MSQLQSPVQTPAQTRKRVRSGTPPGTPVGDDNDITAVDDSDVDSEEDSDDDGDDSDEEDEAPFAGMAIPTPPAGPHEAWWNAHYTPLSPPATEDLGFDQIQIQYNPKHWTRNYLEYDILSPDDTLESFLDAHRIQKGGLCSHTAMNGWRGGAWFIPKCLNREFLLLFFRDSIMAKKPIPLTEKYLRGYEFYFFVDWEMPSKEMYNDFLATNRLEDLQFLRLFAGLCDFARPGKYNRVRLIFSRNPDHPNKMHINYDLAVTSEEATRFCADLQARFQAAFVSEGYNWDKIFDKGPYNNGGLRILGACKEGQLSSYQILDLHSGVYEPLHVQQLIATSMRTEYREGDAPLYGNLGTTVCSEHDALLRKYVDELKAAKAFPTQSLEVLAVKPGFDGRTFIVNLKDDFCPYIRRPHSRTSSYMYLFVSGFGCWLKCYDSDCHERNDHRSKDLPVYIRELFEEVEQEIDPNGVKSIVRKEWANGDAGMAMILHHFLKSDAMYSTSTKSLYHYDEAKCLWEIVTQNVFKWTMTKTIEKALRPLVKEYVNNAANEPDKKKKEMLDKWAVDVLTIIKKYNSTRALSLLYPMFEGLVTFQDAESNFDRIPYLLGVANGVIDLRTGELRARTREDNLFRISPIVYDPDADTSFVEDMYSSIMADDDEMKRYLQLCLGYAISGESKEEIVLVFTGVGRNGKGGTIQTMAKIMGASMATINNGVILKRQGMGGNMDAERARIQGLRVALFNEIGDGEILNTAELQMLSGRDGINIKRLYCDPTEIKHVQHVCLITTNWSPKIPIKEVTTSIIERLIIINFPVTFAADLEGEEPTLYKRQAVRELKDKLEAELGTFLKWLVQGAVRYYQEGGGLKAKAPQKVKASTDAYFAKQDIVKKFVNDECTLGPDYSEECDTLFGQFQSANPDCGVDRPNFVYSLNQMGVVSKRVRIRGTIRRETRYIGVRLRHDLEEDEIEVNNENEPTVPVI